MSALKNQLEKDLKRLNKQLNEFQQFTNEHNYALFHKNIIKNYLKHFENDTPVELEKEYRPKKGIYLNMGDDTIYHRDKEPFYIISTGEIGDYEEQRIYLHNDKFNQGLVIDIATFKDMFEEVKNG